jgi:hypothetical protein
MKMQIATCGHEVSSDWVFSDKASVHTRAYTREGYKAVSYMTVCEECKNFLRKIGKILDTEEERLEWMRG